MTTTTQPGTAGETEATMASTTTPVFTIAPKPATGNGDIDGYSATCPDCGYVIAYSIESMVRRDMTGHMVNYCRGGAE